MASKGKKTPRKAAIAALNDITRAKPHPNDLWGVIMKAEDSLLMQGQSIHNEGMLTSEFLQNLGKSTMPDATFALVISTAVDQALELAISTHFTAEDDVVQLMFDGNANGPLADFAAKIKMARALGIYPAAIKEELDLIRHIRNAFAHSWENMDFTNKIVIDACSQLRLPDHYKRGKIYPAITWTPISRFLQSARFLYVYLEWNGGGKPMLYSTHPQRALFEKVQAAREKE
jgi:DNA-binding MltR family transcriptional regulator